MFPFRPSVVAQISTVIPRLDTCAARLDTVNKCAAISRSHLLDTGFRRYDIVKNGAKNQFPLLARRSSRGPIGEGQLLIAVFKPDRLEGMLPTLTGLLGTWLPCLLVNAFAWV